MKTKAFIYIIVAGLLWGTSGLFAHVMTPYGFTSLQITAVRGTVAFLGMLIFILIRDRGLFKIRVKNLILYIACGATLYLTASLYFTSMQMTSVATAVVLMYTSPIYVVAISVAFMGERLTKWKTVSVIAMLLGCIFVSGVLNGLAFDLVGVLLGVASGISYAGYNLSAKLAIQRGEHSLSLTLYSFLIMMLIAWIVTPPWEIVAVAAKAPMVTVPLCIGIGIVTFIMPYFLYMTALETLPAGTASALSVVEPMAATVFSMIFLSQPVDFVAWIGIALIVGATVMLGKS